jgi:hypothetical protein
MRDSDFGRAAAEREPYMPRGRRRPSPSSPDPAVGIPHDPQACRGTGGRRDAGTFAAPGSCGAVGFSDAHWGTRQPLSSPYFSIFS